MPVVEIEKSKFFLLRVHAFYVEVRWQRVGLLWAAHICAHVHVRDSHPHGHVSAASAMDEDGSVTLAYLWLVGEYHRSAIVEAPA